jgi:hypothetical protein
MRLLARRSIRNENLLDRLSVAIVTNESLLSQIRILHCFEIGGSLGKLRFLRNDVKNVLISKVQNELPVIPIEELWKTCTSLNGQIWFSLREIEDLIWNELKLMVGFGGTSVTSSGGTVSRVHSILTQVSRPIEFINFLNLNSMLTRDVVLGACKWANDTVYLPLNRVNKYRRPTMFEVALIADLCREYSIPLEEISKAVRISVVTKGGEDVRKSKPKPLKYRRRRAFLKGVDGYEEAGVVPVIDYAFENLTKEMKSNEAAFAPRLRKLTDKPLWKARSNAWFFRK